MTRVSRDVPAPILGRVAAGRFDVPGLELALMTVGAKRCSGRCSFSTLMLDMAQVDQASLVVELGAGTGSHTAALLERLAPEARLLVFEIDPGLASAVRVKLPDPRLQVVTGSAEDVADVLDGRHPQIIVSTLPFTSLPAGIGRTILQRAAGELAPGGTMLVLQYSPLMAGKLSRVFASVRRQVCLLNVPPAFLFACRDPRSPGAAAAPRSR